MIPSLYAKEVQPETEQNHFIFSSNIIPEYCTAFSSKYCQLGFLQYLVMSKKNIFFLIA